MTLWTREDQERASAEGWAIFNVSADEQEGEIQRLDEHPTFTHDDAIIAHLRARAERGSDFAKRALTMHRNYISSRAHLPTLD